MFESMALPWDETLKSLVELKDDESVLKSSVLWILLTNRGERVMLPEFGTNLLEKVFEMNDSQNAADLLSIVSSAVRKWDSRIEVQDLKSEILEDNNVRIRMSFSNVREGNETAAEILTFVLGPGSVIFQ